VKQPFLSVIIPCYEEMANLQKGVLDKVEHYLSKQKYSYEVIIVDDGSKDGSVDFIKKFIKEYPHFRIIQNEHLGKAGAVTEGVLQAKGKYILFTDMDQATPIEEIEKFFPHFESGYNIVIGSRGAHREGAPFSRLIISWGSILLRKWIIGLGELRDTQCGFKAFEHDTAHALFAKIKELHQGYQKIVGSAVKAGFDMELLFIAKKMGYTIKEVPVSWLYVESRRVSPIRDSIDGIIDLLRIRQNDMSGKYKHI
jgi:dolichyl-phosphate beta-glucosyltransferase